MTELQREYDETVKATLADAERGRAEVRAAREGVLLLVGDYSKIGPGLERAQRSARSCCSTRRGSRSVRSRARDYQVPRFVLLS